MVRPVPRLVPQLRGHVEPRVVAHWRRAGWAVHQVGQAAYVHGPAGHHFLVGVWRRGAERPAWADRLGRPSAGYLRRLARIEREQRGRWYARGADGRFVGKLPWWRVRPVRAYRFEPATASMVEQEQGLAAESRAGLRARGWWS